MGTIKFTGTGGIIEGDLDATNVEIDLDAPYIFDGNDDMFTVADHNDFDLSATLTLSAWIKPVGTGDTWQMVATKNGVGGDADRPYAMWYRNSDKRIYFYVGDDSSSSSLGTNSDAVVVNKWNHVAVTFDNSSNTGKIYVNGVLVKTGTSMSTSPYNSSKSFSIGAVNDNDGGSASDEFVGNIVDVKVFSDVLTDAEVQEISSKINYDISRGSIGNLVAWYKLMGAVADSSGNSHNLTAVGSPAQDYDAFTTDAVNGSYTTTGTTVIKQGTLNCKPLTSLLFDGDADNVDTNSALQSMIRTGFSYSMWVKPDDGITGTNQGLFGAFQDSNNSHVLYIDSGAGKLSSRMVTDGATKYAVEDSASFVNGANDWTQVGFSITYVDSSNATMKLYVNGEERTLDSSNNGALSGNLGNYTSTGDFRIGINPHSGGLQWDFAGKIRDVKVYDHVLSVDQMKSNYYNTYPVSPEYWWRIDDNGHAPAGSAYVESFGVYSDPNAVRNGATWNNETLTLSAKLTIGQSSHSDIRAILSCPRGTAHLINTFENFGSITHNKGLFKFDNASSMYVYQDALGGNAKTPTFYNVTMAGSGGDGYRISGSINIENDWIIDNTRTSVSNNAGGGHNSGVVVTIGTATSAGSITVNSGKELETYAYSNSHSVTYQGVSSLYPAVFTNNGVFEETLGSLLETVPEVKFGNLQFVNAYATRPEDGQAGGGSKITMIGDCVFDDLTLTLGDDELHTGGFRLEAVDFTVQGSTTLNWEDSLCVFSGHVDLNGNITTANSDTKIIHNTAAEKNWRSLYADAGVFFANGTQTTMTGYQWASAGNEPINVIAGSTFNTNNFKVNCTNLTVPTGGEFDAKTNVHTIAGDFTTSGGLLGKGCLSLDRDNTEYARSVNHADLDLFYNRNAMTAEMWFKTAYTGNNHQHLFNLKDNDGSPQVMQAYIEWSTNKINARIFTSGTTNTLVSQTQVRDGKWHHLALVYDGGTGEHSLYLDGKLEASETGSGAVYAATDCEFNIGTRWTLDQGYVEGEIDEVRLFAAAKTAAQIRKDMFVAEGTNLTHFNSQATAGSDGLVGRWGCNDVSGSTLTCSNSNLNMTIYDYAAGPAAYEDAWGAGGTFDKGTDSTVNMTGADGKLYLGSGGYQFENLGLAPSGGTTTLTKVGGHGNMRVYKTLTHNGGTFAQSGNMATEIKGSGTVSAGATIPYICYWSSSTNVPTSNYNYFIADTTTVTFAGNCTFTGYWRTNNKTIIGGALSHSVRSLVIDASGTFDLRNTTVTMTGTTGSTNFNDPNSTFITGNTTITGHASRTYWTSPAAAGHEIIGDVSNLNFQAGNDLTVIGSISNCIGTGFRQWTHTMDTQQMLDADSGGSDDIRLEKPALDNTHEIKIMD